MKEEKICSAGREHILFCNQIQLELTTMSTNKYSVSVGQKKCLRSEA
jgi:hypothetical protein